MEIVNKQCLLDTPRTVRVSEKTWQVIANKNYKPLHAYVQCIYIV